MSSNPQPDSPRNGWRRPLIRRVVEAVALFGLWIAFSGVFVWEFLALGAIAAVGAVSLTDLLFRGTKDPRYPRIPGSAGWVMATGVKFFFVYTPWLVWQVIVSNIHVIALILNPKMPINPSLVEFKTSLISERAQVLLAQSITLTPGTVTVDASDGTFMVHALSTKTREGLETGDIQRKVAWVFSEPSAERIELTDVEVQKTDEILG